MRIKVVSDLHLESCKQVPDLGEGEILILGGDILCARHLKTSGTLYRTYTSFLQRCSDNFNHVLYVAGNHEPYGYNYEGSFRKIRENLPDRIHLLENESIKLGEWVFLGCTLWTDFRKGNPLDMMEAAQRMNDYKVVRITPKYRKMNPDDTYRFHNNSKQFLLDSLELYKKYKVWVLTHHAPSYQSVHKKYKSEGTLNSAYVSDLDDFILSHPQIKCWSHGHTHTSFDYMIGECRVVCNPLGYYDEYNPDFDPGFELIP
jgi:predicted phosphodiesterase